MPHKQSIYLISIAMKRIGDAIIDGNTATDARAYEQTRIYTIGIGYKRIHSRVKKL